MAVRKKVELTIEVPEGDHCWGPGCQIVDRVRQYQICDHFDNEGGHPTCKIDFLFSSYPDLKYDKEGYIKKPEECRELLKREN